MEKCAICEGSIKNGYSNFMTDIDDNHFIIIRRVPSYICSQCGEAFFDLEVSKKLESMVDELKMMGMEVIIINYNQMTRTYFQSLLKERSPGANVV